MISTGALEGVTALLAEMPGIGKKTAQRLTYFILHRDSEYAQQLATAMTEMRTKLRWCENCFNISELPLCEICRQGDRDKQLLCVVEDAVNVANIERSGGYRGAGPVLAIGRQHLL